MDVILRRYVENVGDRGQVVKVANGFARNYLIPRKLALPVTPGNLKYVERERERVEAHETGERQEAKTVAAALKAAKVVIARRVGDTQALYGSVTSADITAALAEQDVEIDRRRVQLSEPIKRLGEYAVTVKLYRDIVGTVTVKVVAEGAGTEKPAEETAAGDSADGSSEADAHAASPDEDGAVPPEASVEENPN